MAWSPITNNTMYEYDNAPPDPGDSQTGLWLKQVSGIRTDPDGSQNYTRCRRIGSTVSECGEISKTYWDNV